MTCLSPPAQCWDSKCIPQCRLFLTWFWGFNCPGCLCGTLHSSSFLSCVCWKSCYNAESAHHKPTFPLLSAWLDWESPRRHLCERLSTKVCLTGEDPSWMLAVPSRGLESWPELKAENDTKHGSRLSLLPDYGCSEVSCLLSLPPHLLCLGGLHLQQWTNWILPSLSCCCYSNEKNN